MEFKLKSLGLAILAATLVACGTGSGGGYEGPVKGSAIPQAEPKSANQTPSPEHKSINAQKTTGIETGAQNPVAVAEDARFVEVSAGVLNPAKYIASQAIKYDFGKLIINGKQDPSSKGQSPQNDPASVYVVPFEGWIRYPQANVTQPQQKYPVIVFIHGQHDTSDPSYQGYDYLAKNLAENGYVVVSIDANKINEIEDVSSQGRAQLVLGTLDKLKQLNESGGPGSLTQLRSKLDFNRIGIVGHSRGGQAINLAVKFNSMRYGNDLALLKSALKAAPTNFKEFPELLAAAADDAKLTEQLALKNISFAKTTNSALPYNFKAALSLAPTDFDDIKGLSNVPYATLLPSCDGDVSSLHGSKNYEYSRFSMQYDTAPKYQIVVRGANHNFYNTTWLEDDYTPGDGKQASKSNESKDFCSLGREGSTRQNAVDQRRTGQFLINSFLRYFVGEEQQFKAYWHAVGQLPESACPKGDLICDSRVLLSVQKHGAKLIQRFEDDNALTLNLLGGFNQFSGFNQDKGIIACKAHLGLQDSQTKSQKCSDETDSFFAPKVVDSYTGGLLSFSDQLHLYWSQANPSYALNLNKMSTAGYDSLTFRVALPQDVGQEIIIELTDLQGKKSRVLASDFSDALYTVPRNKVKGMPMVVAVEDQPYAGKTAELLNMISIPLKAFKGIDSQYIDKLEFIFPKDQGAIALNDIQLQKLRR